MKSSQPDIEFKQLAGYVFGKLSEQEETELEALLDRNPHYADVVDGIRSFALDRNILTLEEFERAWNAEVEPAKRAAKLSSGAKRGGSTFQAMGFVIGITAGLICGYFWGYTITGSKPKTPPDREDSLQFVIKSRQLQIDSLKRIIIKRDSALPFSAPPVPEFRLDRKPVWRTDSVQNDKPVPEFRLDRNPLLYEFWEYNRDIETGGAGTSDSLSWLRPFKSREFRKQDLVNSLRLLETIPEKEATTRQKYYRGCLTFLLRPEDNDTAIRFLEQSQYYRGDARAFLILAREERRR